MKLLNEKSTATSPIASASMNLDEIASPSQELEKVGTGTIGGDLWKRPGRSAKEVFGSRPASGN